MWFNKKIINVEILQHIEGISEDDQLSNYVVRHMMGGFDGMVHASILNESEGPETIFRVYYDNGTHKDIRTKDGSSTWRYYMQMIKD